MATGKIEALPKFIVKDYSVQITCGGNNYGYATAAALGMTTPTGYSVMCVSKFSSDPACPVTAVTATAVGAQGAVWVRNVTSSTVNPNISLSIIYVREDLVA